MTMIPIQLRQRRYQALVAALGSFDAIRVLQQAGWVAGNYSNLSQTLCRGSTNRLAISQNWIRLLG